MLLVRLGGDGIEYTGDVYVTNIKLDSTALALADIDLEVLASSYGDGLAGVEVCVCTASTNLPMNCLNKVGTKAVQKWREE